MRHFVFWTLGLILLSAAGCGSGTLNDSYGHSTGQNGRDSINGFGALRNMFESAGWKTTTMRRLSPKADACDAFVWVPTQVQTPGVPATQWFDDWLAERPRTLVFVCKGYLSGAAEYYASARKLASPSQKMEYRRREIRSAMNTMRFDPPTAKTVGNGWFTLVTKSTIRKTTEIQGAWTESVDVKGDPLNAWATIREHSSADSGLTTGALGSKRSGRLTKAANDQDAGLQKASATVGASVKNAPVNFQPLLQTGGNKPETLVAELTSDRWPDSRVIVFNSGQTLMNLPLIELRNRQIASKLLEALGEPSEIGFYRTERGARVSGQASDDLASGMELLTTWPLSMTTMHAVVFGLITCLALLPIFGRPRRQKTRTQSDFADHIQGVGTLLEKTRASDYAIARIAQYAVQVRGDDAHLWPSYESTVHNPAYVKQTPSEVIAVDSQTQSEHDASGNRLVQEPSNVATSNPAIASGLQSVANSNDPEPIESSQIESDGKSEASDSQRTPSTDHPKQGDS